MDLCITEKIVTISNGLDGAWVLGTPNNAIGNVVSLLCSEFPGIEYRTSEEHALHIVNSIRNAIKDGTRSESDWKTLWGMRISHDDVFTILQFLNDSNKWYVSTVNGKVQELPYKVELTMQDVELWRIRRHITNSVIPDDWLNIDYSKGLRMTNIQSIYDVVYGLLYYSAINGLKLAKCEHCGQWFATTSFKNKYCSRKSNFPGYEHLPCEQAVRNILQRCGRTRNRIETKMRAVSYSHQNIDVFWENFCKTCDNLYYQAKSSPTKENLKNYMDFLYRTDKERGWLE